MFYQILYDSKVVQLDMHMPTNKHQDYNKDFYAWTLETAMLIRQGKFSEIDIEHVAEEIESMGKSDRRQLINRLSVLIAHLLKWRLQVTRRRNSWRLTIREQRFSVDDLLTESPSLKYELQAHFQHAYERSILKAAKEMKLDLEQFPKMSPFTLEQCLDKEFFPD